LSDRNIDVAIIGAGTAGLAAERNARRTGATTVLIDKHFSGTTCTNVGCMPSKLLIAAARAAHSVATAEVFGISVEARIDGPAVMRRIRKLRNEFVGTILESFEKLPEGVALKGAAKFVEEGVLQVGEQRINAKAIVIATGSSPVIPKVFHGLRNIHTNETIFDLEEIPRSLAVIGAGPLGLELAQAFSRLGVRVAVFDEGDKISALRDEKVAQMLKDILCDELDLKLGTDIRSAANVGAGVELNWEGDKPGRETFDCVLVAAGRPPNVKELGLAESGLKLDEHGVPEFDRQTMQCGNSAVFMAGDADADAPVLHEASAEGGIAGYNAASYPEVRKSKRMVPLAITFVEPSVATVGSSLSDGMLIGEASYADQGRAKVDGQNEGIIRIYAERDGLLKGATFVAPQGEHLAHLVAWAIQTGHTATSLLEMPFYHPTVEEGLRTALREICKQVDKGIPSYIDEGDAPGF
jgi:dihydrolipoamide dehydrogenase